MNKELILKSTFLDILFENKNKAYGAYHLRKFYNNRLYKSLALMLSGVILLSAFTFLPKSKKPKGDVVDTKDFILTNAELPKKKTVIETIKNTADKKAKLATIKNMDRFKIVDSNEVVDKIENTDGKIISNANTAGILGNDGPLTFGDSDSGNVIEKKPLVVVTPDVTTPREKADVMPSFPGGMEALKRFLQKNLINPTEMEEGELVSVKVKFVVGYDGKLTSFEVQQDGGKQYNEEVIRVIKKMPTWIPGKSNGQSVPVFYVIPVKFIPST
jgi:periplasmic protein TonB